MKSILVVDDEQDIILALKILLAEEGYEIFTAHNGREALERLAEKIPDIMLIDVMMPILSGPETIVRMRADAGYANIPVVVMSAIKPKADLDKLKVGAFIRKPFEIELLLQTLDQVLAEKKK